MTEAQADLDCLLQSLTWDNWFDMLPILSDAFREAKGWEAGDAVDWLIENRKRPRQVCYDDLGNFGDYFIWRIADESHWSKRDNIAKDQSTMPREFSKIIDRFHSPTALKFAIHSWCETGIWSLLEAFVSAWLVEPITNSPETLSSLDSASHPLVPSGRSR